MKKTVLITGCSSGIGQATALHFYKQGWNVIASMRNPEKRSTLLHEKGLPDLVHLDVMDQQSIHAAINYALQKYQRIDALVNNAGYAMYGPFELTSPEQIERQFETNVFGLMEMTRAMLPVFRSQGDGAIVNVTSMGGKIGFPLYTCYNSSKFAVEGFSEALQYELKPQHIRVKIVEPGVIKTDFFSRSMDHPDLVDHDEVYAALFARADRTNSGASRTGSDPSVVAGVIFKAANDRSSRLRYPAGPDAHLVNGALRLLPPAWFFKIIEKYSLG